MDELVFSLPHSPDSVRSARLAVRGALASLDGGVVEMSALLVDELVANAVVHGEGAITLVVVVHPDCVRITVADAGTMLPVHQPPSSRSESGRGLSIVNAAASRWGVDATDHPKWVWFELEVPR